MNNKSLFRIILIFLIVSMNISDLPLPLPAAGVDPVQAGPFGPNMVLGFIRSLEAINARNRVYREAGITVKEINQYYDTLLENSRIAYREMDQRAKKGEIPPAFAASYKKIEAGLEAERAAAIQMIEAEKKGARASFKKNVKKHILNILVASPGAQNLLLDIRETINGVRQAVQTIKLALSANLPTESLINFYSEQLGGIPWVKAAVHHLGSKIGQELNKQMGGIISRLEKPSSMILAEMEDAEKKVNELDHYTARLQNRVMNPYSLLETASDLSGFRALDRSKAGVDAVATAYTQWMIDNDLLDESDKTHQSMRDQIRKVLQDSRMSNLLDRTSSATQFASCHPSNQEEYLKAVAELGLTPEEPLDPTRAKYVVCLAYPSVIDENTKTDIFGSVEPVIIHAALIGPSKTDAAEVAEAETQTAETAQAESEITYIPETYEGSTMGDADSCDAKAYLSLELGEGPVEETSDSGSYYCYQDYSITNTHPDKQIVISWKHADSTIDRGPYWTHPKLEPGGSYPFTLRSNKAANGVWSTIDGDYLMAWFATMECDLYQNQFWTTDEEPDKMLTAGFEWIEIENPCGR